MSQQYIDPNGSMPEGRAGYGQRDVPYDGYSADMAGQKLSAKASSIVSSSAPLPRQSLILAIVSLVTWLIAFYIVVQVIGSIPSAVPVVPPPGGGPPYAQDNGNWQHFLSQMLFTGLAVFSVLILAINFIFNFANKNVFYNKH